MAPEIYNRPSVSPARGFLNIEASLATLPPVYDGLVAICKDMGTWLKKHQLRPYFDKAPMLELPERLTKRQEQLLFTVYATLASAYIFSIHEKDEQKTLPGSLAAPLYRLALRLDVPPILNYNAYVCSNFTQDRRYPTLPESYTPMFTFSSPEDAENEAERGFIANHVAAEQIIGPSVAGLCWVLEHLEQGGDSLSVIYFLRDMERALKVMTRTLSGSKSGPGSNLFEDKTQRYLSPFKGVVFEGVQELQGKPQYLDGAAVDQSAVPRVIEAFLGLPRNGRDDRQLTAYIVPEHRGYIEEILEHKPLKEHVDARPELQVTYEAVLSAFSALRTAHTDSVTTHKEPLLAGDKTDKATFKEVLSPGLRGTKAAVSC